MGIWSCARTAFEHIRKKKKKKMKKKNGNNWLLLWSSMRIHQTKITFSPSHGYAMMKLLKCIFFCCCCAWFLCCVTVFFLSFYISFVFSLHIPHTNLKEAKKCQRIDSIRRMLNIAKSEKDNWIEKARRKKPNPRCYHSSVWAEDSLFFLSLLNNSNEQRTN